MPCTPHYDEAGRCVMISCTRTRRCVSCVKPATSYCDSYKKDGTPCDLPLCDDCKITVAEDTDVCKYHNYPKYIESALERRKVMESEPDKIEKDWKKIIQYVEGEKNSEG
jgi:hypothetical protein